MNRILLLVLFLFLLPVVLTAQGRIEFINEKIDFSITSELFKINGIYMFVNSSENENHQMILFPFPGESDKVDIVRVFNLSYNEDLPYQKVARGIVFRMILMPYDTVNINISYNQKTEKVNTYILESARTWNKPLLRADYSLSYDNTVMIDSLSPEPDSLINNVYFWTRTDFYPNENFIVWIK
jgi:hypothetical protein